MSVYKEGYHIINKLLPKQVQIFADACDNGIPVKKDDATWNMIKQLVDWYGIKGSRSATKLHSGWSGHHDVMLGTECHPWVETTYRVSYNDCNKGRCKGFKGFISIDKIE